MPFSRSWGAFVHPVVMALPMTATKFLSALKAPGLSVREVGTWRTHNRNHKGKWGPANGIMIHHTVTRGTASTVQLCRDGYEGLPGPLCHVVADKQGVLHLIGYGRTNHAGLGDQLVLNRVIREDLGTNLKPRVNDTDGNARFYGFELINLGDGVDPWPDMQLNAVAKACASLLSVHGWTSQSVIGHKEWQVGKVDPKGFSMDSFRKRIDSFM